MNTNENTLEKQVQGKQEEKSTCTLYSRHDQYWQTAYLKFLVA